MRPRIAFYAPLKSPDHPRASGDRTMGRLLRRALEDAGFVPELASELRTRDGEGDPARQRRSRDLSLAEADRLVADYRARPAAERPALWFTYHVYYKAPDWIGPRVAAALGIPYIVAEGSRAGKRAGGPWALGHEGAEAALDRAALILVINPADREALERTRPERQRLVDLPPFLDLAEWSPSPLEGEGGRRMPAGRGGALGTRASRSDGVPRETPSLRDAPSWAPPSPDPRSARTTLPLKGGGTVCLLAVAMMRDGDKLASYRLLAEALARIAPLSWTLDVAGDGEARGAVEALFAPFGARVRFHGAVAERRRLASLYAASDLLVWPAVNEAYGMALLEAQAHGCPVVAGGFGGVAAVVLHGRTGLICPPGDAEAFAEAAARLVGDPVLRAALGTEAGRFVREERGLDRAAALLSDALLPLLARGPVPA